MQFLIFLLLIPVFWVLIIRPQQMQRKAHQEVVAGLRVGDRVMTVGGLIGTLTDVGTDLVRLDVGDGHELTFGRTFVRSMVPVHDEPAALGDETASAGHDVAADGSGAAETTDRTEGLAS